MDVISDAVKLFSQHDLYFNKKKTQLIRFQNRQKLCDVISIDIEEESLTTSESNIKFLGLHVDKNLNWRCHCECLVSKLNSLAYLFKNLRSILTIAQLKSLYYAQVESRLRYGVCLWGNTTLFPKVFIAQKRVIRSIAGVSNRQTCKVLFERYGLLTLPSLFVLEVSSYIFLNRHKFLRVSDTHAVNTRRRNDLFVPFTRLGVTGKSPDYFGLKLFNSLPTEIAAADNLIVFKKKLKSFLLSRCLYNVSDIFI